MSREIGGPKGLGMQSGPVAPASEAVSCPPSQREAVQLWLHIFTSPRASSLHASPGDSVTSPLLTAQVHRRRDPQGEDGFL